MPIRRGGKNFWPVALLVALTGGIAAVINGPRLNAQSRQPVTADTVDAWMTELSNWGRWGTDDQLGTLNLITPDTRKAAVALVQDGVSVSLARDAEKAEAVDNPNPWGHEMRGVGSGAFAMDTYTINYHGFAHTHLDSLCHFSYQGKMYNGFSQDAVQPEGCAALSIHNSKQGIFARGVLIDIPLLKGVDYLDPGTVIYPEDLDAWEAKTGLTIGSGDVVFIRTGRWA